MIYKALSPSELMPGDRVSYLGRLRTVLEASVESPENGCLVSFRDGMRGRLVNDVSVVDELKTQLMLMRYSRMT
jgi:hypothetical protein